MNKKLNLFIRIIAIAAAGAACVFAVLLRGKVGVAMAATQWTVSDPDIAAPLPFEGRMAAVATKVKPILDERSKKISELEGSVKDLRAEIADKTTKMETLAATVTTLEGERAELTRKRDELIAQAAEATSKKDSIAAELDATKQEMVIEKQKTASMFTKEQVEAEIAKTAQAMADLEKARGKYVQLFGWATGKSDSQPPFPRDPLATEEAAAGTPGAPSFSAEGIITKVIAIDIGSGLVALSVGEKSGVRTDSKFELHVGGAKAGNVSISASRPNVAYANLLPGFQVSQVSNGAIVTLVPFAAAN